MAKSRFPLCPSSKSQILCRDVSAGCKTENEYVLYLAKYSKRHQSDEDGDDLVGRRWKKFKDLVGPVAPKGFLEETDHAQRF